MGVLTPIRPALLALVALGAAVSWPAQARTFHIIPSTAAGWLIIDPATVESLPGGVVRRTWTVGVQRSIVGGDISQPGYVRTLTDYDCITRQTRWRSFSAFARNGALLLSRDNPSVTWVRADATAETDAALRIVCDGRGGGGAISADSVARVVILLMAAWDPPGGSATPPPAPKVTAPVASTKVATAPARPAPRAAAPATRAAAVKPATPAPKTATKP